MVTETKATHTAGPWETGSTMTRVEVWPAGWNAPLCVADCHTKNAPESEGERVANARLIAAAPEMLEALRECITDDGAACMNTGQKSRRLAEISRLARAAIAKAIGEAV